MTRCYAAGTGLVSAALLVVVWQGFGHDLKVPKDILTKKNPVAASDSVVAQAKTAYEENCAQCHGAGGKGDGPMAGMLKERPADISDATIMAEMTDGELFWVVTKGYPPTMPPFDNKLTDNERWGLVHLLRSMSKTKPNTKPHAGH